MVVSVGSFNGLGHKLISDNIMACNTKLFSDFKWRSYACRFPLFSSNTNNAKDLNVLI